MLNQKQKAMNEYIKIQMRPMSEFDRKSVKLINVNAARGIKALIGQLKSDPEGPTKVKTYLFAKDKWTPETAGAWIKQNQEKAMPKILKGYVQKVEDSKQGILSVAVATDSSVDRDDERIDANGWDFNNFLKNPVLLWAHDYREEPIGKVLEIRKEGDKIIFRPQLAIDISETAKRIFELFQKGYLNAFSVGFIPREWKDEDAGGKRVRTFTRAELLEISAVPVPANPNAVVLARSFAKEKGFELEKIGVKTDEVLDEKGDAINAPADETPAAPAEGEKPKEGEAAAAGGEAPQPLSDEAKNFITETVADLVAEKFADIELKIAEIKTAVSGNNAQGTEGKASDEKVDAESGIDLSKRVLQAIDKGLGEALREIKSARQRNK